MTNDDGASAGRSAATEAVADRPAATLRHLGGRPVAWDRTALAAPADVVAPQLLGAVLSRAEPDGTSTSIRIVECEAYREDDPASHAHAGPTARARTMFGPPGHLYVYFTYGMHHCANVVCEPEGTGAGVLLRAGVVLAGSRHVEVRRGPAYRATTAVTGPARLADGLGIDRRFDGADLLGDGCLRLLDDGWRPPRGAIVSGPRVGVRRAAATPWRFHLAGVAEVSTYRAHPRAEPAER